MPAVKINRDFGEVRDGEKPRTWYRNDRVFKNKGGWYISTREGVDVGPYTCQFDAEVEAELMIRRLANAEPERARQVVDNQVAAACSGEHLLNTTAYTDYLVEEGGLELLRKEAG